jgi:hypothetical protein
VTQIIAARRRAAHLAAGDRQPGSGRGALRIVGASAVARFELGYPQMTSHRYGAHCDRHNPARRQSRLEGVAGEVEVAAPFLLGDHAQRGHELAGDHAMLGGELVDDVERPLDLVRGVDDDGDHRDAASELQ